MTYALNFNGDKKPKTQDITQALRRLEDENARLYEKLFNMYQQVCWYSLGRLSKQLDSSSHVFDMKHESNSRMIYRVKCRLMNSRLSRDFFRFIAGCPFNNSLRNSTLESVIEPVLILLFPIPRILAKFVLTPSKYCPWIFVRPTKEWPWDGFLFNFLKFLSTKRKLHLEYQVDTVLLVILPNCQLAKLPKMPVL